MVFEKLKGMLAKQLSIDAARINESTDIIKDLGADSLDLVDTLMNIEEEWGIEIEDDVVQSFKTVGDVVAYIESLI